MKASITHLQRRGIRLRALRKALGLTQREVGVAIGKGAPYVSIAETADIHNTEMASLILRQRWIFQHLCNLTPQARWRRRQERAASHWSGAAAAAINGPLGWLIAEIVVALHKRGRSLEGSRLATLRQDALPEALPMLIADIIQSIDWEKPENAPLDRALQDLERFAGIPTDLVWTEMLSDATHYPAGAFVEADA